MNNEVLETRNMMTVTAKKIKNDQTRHQMLKMEISKLIDQMNALKVDNSNILKNVRTRIGLMRSDKEPNEDKREEWKRRHKEKDITSTDNESSMSPEFRKSVSPKKTEKTSLQIGKIDEESDMSLTNEDD